MVGALQDFGSVFGRWRLWWLMANQDIQMRYKRSVIGPFWISITLACLMLALTYLYSQIFQQEFGEFLIYFGSGLVVWVYVTGLILDGCGIVLENEGNMRSVPMPIPVLASRIVARNAIILGHNLLVAIPILMLFGVRFTPIALMALPGLVLCTAIGFFGAIILGPLCARFRDVPQVVTNIVQAGMFLTPLFWRPEQLTDTRSAIVDFNPVYHLLKLTRGPLLGETPDALHWLVALGLVAALALFSFMTLASVRKRVFLWL